jgi:radical SAM superfamily enzyme
MTREEALKKLKVQAYSEEQIKEDFEFISNKLGITTDELWSYFYAPKKTYRDYRSQESIYNLGASVMRLIGFERGGKR